MNAPAWRGAIDPGVPRTRPSQSRSRRFRQEYQEQGHRSVTDVLPWEGDDEATSGLDPLKAARLGNSRKPAYENEVAGLAPAPMPVTLISKSAMPSPLTSPSTRPPAKRSSPGCAAEAAAADEVEGLVAAGGRIGVDGLQVDPSFWARLKPWMMSCLAPTRLSRRLVEIEGVRTVAAELDVPADDRRRAGRCRPRP